MNGWVLDKSAAVRPEPPAVGQQLRELAGSLHVCPIGEHEQLVVRRLG